MVVSRACVQNLVDWTERLIKAAGTKGTKKFHSVSNKHLSPETATKSLRPHHHQPSPMPPILLVHP